MVTTIDQETAMSAYDEQQTTKPTTGSSLNSTHAPLPKRVGDTGKPKGPGPAPKPSPAASGQAQHDKAELASFKGLKAAMTLAAKRMHAETEGIKGAIAKPMHPQGGTQMQITEIKTGFAAVRSIADRLRVEFDLELDQVGTPAANHGYGPQLEKELSVIDGVFDDFVTAMNRAQDFATANGTKLDELTEWVRTSLAPMHKKVGLDMSSNRRSRDIDKRSDDMILAETIDENLTAALETAVSARMGITTTANAAKRDLYRLMGHIKEVKAVIESSTTKTKYKTRVDRLVNEVETLRTVIGTNPTLADTMQKSDLQLNLDAIKKSVGGK
jgi:hypothetical protein